MARILLAALIAASLPSFALAELRLPELPSLSSVMEKLQIQSERMRVSLDIRGFFNGDRYDLTDSMARIDMEVYREAGGKGFNFSGTVDGRYLTGRVESRQDGSWGIWGGGLNVDMRKRGNSDYEISGFVDEINGSRHMDVTLRQRGTPGSFSVWENGADIDISKFASTTSLSGEMDLSRFGKKSLALLSVFVAVLEAQLDAPKSQP
jgi:hypothetical protein